VTAAPHAAVVFDVDGPLLDLTRPEEDVFFVPFRQLHGLDGLSRDWDSYRVRNDEEIFHEILERHLGRPATTAEIAAAYDLYIGAMQQGFADGSLQVSPIPGARDLLATLAGRGGIALGMATANFREAARIRLDRAGMWDFICAHPGAADGGGAKRYVLKRVIDALGLGPDRIVYIGDNLNDLDAAQFNATHFIGFHVAEARRRRLADHGAAVTAGDHADTLKLIDAALSIS